MAKTNLEQGEVDARIVYWGIEGAGKSANLQAIHAKLRSDHRGDLRSLPTPLDPTVTYDVLPIELGEIAGLRTCIETVAVPGSPEQAPTRKQLLDEADGIVFVIDARREQIDANLASFEELRSALGAYGRSLEEVPLVLQYNKRDASDPYALEELHRKLDVRGAAAFEAVATEGTGVIQTLTTISKRVIRALRASGAVPGPEPASVASATSSTEPAEPEPPPAPAPLDLEAAALAAGQPQEPDEAELAAARTQVVLDTSWREVTGEPTTRREDDRCRIVEVGEARLSSERGVELPLVLDIGEGRRVALRMTVFLERADDGSEA